MAQRAAAAGAPDGALGAHEAARSYCRVEASVPGEILALTALRGIAAWWVVLYHFREYLPALGPFAAIIGRGAFAVDVFFVMSGFVMALNYLGDVAHRVTWTTYCRFLGLRLARIYPLHFVTLVLFTSVPVVLALTGREPAPGEFPPGYFLQSLLLVQNWGFADGLAWNLPAWSISAEVLFYLLCPFLLAAAARRLIGWRVGLLALAANLVVIAAFGHAAGGLTQGIVRFGALRCILECGLGVTLFCCWSAIGTPNRLAPTLGTCLVAAVGCYAYGLASDSVAVPFAIVCLIWVVLRPGTWFGRVLSNPLLLWLGRLSYATYMIHFLARYWVKFLMVGRYPNSAVTLTFVAAVLLASVALHHGVELPSRRLGRALVRRWLGESRSNASVRTPPAAALLGRAAE